MKKKVVSALLVSAVCAGCMAMTSMAADSTVRMWTFLDPANTENGRAVALAQMIEEFEAENEGVEVVVEPQDWNTMTAKFLAATTTGDAPDIIWAARDELCGVLNAGALEPLENLFLGEWTEEEIADVDDAYFQFGEKDGQHYTLTVNKNCIVLYYREDLLEKAGLVVPTTWDEIIEVAKALTGVDEETGQMVYGLGQSFATESNDPQLLINYIVDKQGSLFNEDGTANWANEVGLEALKWTTDCIEMGITPAECVNTSIEDIYTEYASGKYAMCIGSGVRLASVRDAAAFDGSTIQITTIPGNTIIDGWFAGVWSGSENKEMAGKFLEKMYSQESDLKWVELGGQAPCRKSTVEAIEITDSNRYLEVMINAFGEGWLPSNEIPFIGWKYDLNNAVQAVLVDGADPMTALEDCEARFNSANDR